MQLSLSPKREDQNPNRTYRISLWESLTRYEELRCTARSEYQVVPAIATRRYEDDSVADAERNADSSDKTMNDPWTALWREERDAEAGRRLSETRRNVERSTVMCRTSPPQIFMVGGGSHRLSIVVRGRLPFHAGG